MIVSRSKNLNLFIMDDYRCIYGGIYIFAVFFKIKINFLIL